ncbi:hypothetical protein AB0M87_18280 [Streptomyces sp. NPDC051320]|uniref:hypothetical protein n=1 Tax=Streptomyces sp. NPDC051320 TaxID=3154644 RepID=UPI0034340DCE
MPYRLQHGGPSLCIKAEVDSVELVRRVSHSQAVLRKFCAKVLRGHQDASKGMIDMALEANEDA